jgi:hypothetical protein
MSLILFAILLSFIFYVELCYWCPCGDKDTANNEWCEKPAQIQRFVQVAMQTVVAPPVMALTWLTNKAALPNAPLFKLLHWLAWSRCEPEQLMSLLPRASCLQSRSNYVWFYWGDYFPTTARCWYRLTVSNAPVWLRRDSKETLWCDQLVLIKQAVCSVTGCAME